MLIDRFMPRYDVLARYRIDIHAPIERAYAAARRMDMCDSSMVRWLLRMRGFPRSALTLDAMFRSGFVLLADNPPGEVVFGLVGRFWTPLPQILRCDADGFAGFHRPGFAKMAGNLAFIPQGDGRSVRVTTETRVRCSCDSSRRSFRLYWLLIGPFSGLIRKEWLRLIKERAEGD